MNSASFLLLIAAMAAVGGSVVLYLINRAGQVERGSRYEQLQVIRPSRQESTKEQPSGIVRVEPALEEELKPGT